MQTSVKLLLALPLAVMVGCSTWGPGNRSEQDSVRANTLMVNSFFSEAAENGIIAQHTLFPYHFVADTARLNALGQGDLEILAQHFKDTPGPLNVRRAGASEDVYKARVAAVVAFLRDKGVNPDKVTVSDSIPGGKGMASEQVISILTKKQQPGEGKVGTEQGSHDPWRESQS